MKSLVCFTIGEIHIVGLRDTHRWPQGAPLGMWLQITGCHTGGVFEHTCATAVLMSSLGGLEQTPSWFRDELANQ